MNFRKKVSCFYIFILMCVEVYFSCSANANEAAQQCGSCHQQQVNDWQQSHHYHAMEHANESTVLGNFDNQEIDYQQSKARFFKEQDQLKISFADAQGTMVTYPVLYTFGYEPLQQFMFDMGKGKIQLFPFAWDSRPMTEGGQRWFIVHPDQQDPSDLFHYTQMGQNWNHMCADCHSTDFEKNFDLKTKSYNSTFSAMNVSCKACHGDASAHLEWANDTNIAANDIKNKGFEHYIGTKTPLFKQQADGTMKSVMALRQSEQISVCAACHSRRTQHQDRTSLNNFFDKFLASVISPELYHVDGQILDENYVWGSFTQSKMFHAGVTCGNCHNPHSGQLTLKGNQTCTQCHSSEVFEAPLHHGHQINTAGSQCVDCHMPATTYMQVDPRRDHSFLVPRPDLTMKTGAPNSCNGCHDDKSSQWALTAIKQLHPDSTRMGSEHFAEAFYAADNRLPNASAMLTKVAQNKQMPDIIRASALARLANTPDQNAMVAIVRAVREPEPLKRQAAVTAAANYPIVERWRMLNSLLDDKHLPVRIEAARALVPILNTSFPSNLNEADIARLNKALAEYKTTQMYQAERGYSHTNLGNIALELTNLPEAEQHYLTAIDVEAIFVPAYVNLADLYRQQGDESKAQALLKQGLGVNPKAADLHYSMAMSLIRTQQKDAAVFVLAKAADLASVNSNYHYTYALLLQDRGNIGEAINAFERAFQLTPNNPDISYSLAQVYVQVGQYDEALNYAQHLSRLEPGNQQIEQLVSQINMLNSIDKK
jgi:tetratricopeptide (TPR) repeat protein